MKATRGRALSSAQIGNPIVPDSRRFSERAARAAAVAARRAAGHGLAAVVVVGRGERARAGAALISRCVAPGEGRGERQPWQTKRDLQSLFGFGRNTKLSRSIFSFEHVAFVVLNGCVLSLNGNKGIYNAAHTPTFFLPQRKLGVGGRFQRCRDPIYLFFFPLANTRFVCA